MEIIIPVKAVGKERPRFSQWGNYVYTPKKTRDFEDLVAMYACQAMARESAAISDGPICLAVVVYTKIPASWKGKKRKDAVDGTTWPMKTPDGDNIFKALADSMNGIVYVDDKQVVQFRFKKVYAAEDSIRVVVTYL